MNPIDSTNANVRKAAELAARGQAPLTNVMTVNPTARNPQSVNGAGYEALVEKVRMAQERLGGLKVFDPQVTQFVNASLADALASFMVDLSDLDPMNAAPYFQMGLRAESKLDIPVIFDPQWFMANPYYTTYFEKQSFTTTNFAAGPVAGLRYSNPGIAPQILGVFLRIKKLNLLQQASFRVQHTVESAALATTDLVYDQSFYLVNDTAAIFVPYLSWAFDADVDVDVNGILTPTVSIGTQYLLGARGFIGFSPQAGPPAHIESLASDVIGTFDISNLSNVTVEATLVPNWGNASLALTRAILEDRPAALFEAINTGLI